jgi:membrane protein involved in colicin uptake
MHLLANAKTSSITMQAAVTEDVAVNAGAVQAAAIQHTDLLAAQQQAAYDAKIAAEKAAAAKAAADAAAAQAAQQAAQQQSVQQAAPQRSAPVNNGPSPASGTSGLPAGSPVPWIPSTDPNNSAGGSWDTQACASHNASGNPAVCD